MNFNNENASLLVPDGTSTKEAIARTTHLAIGAHQDDLEFMALHGILACFQVPGKWFGGVTCTNGAGSPRSGPYADFSDEEMRAVRRREQETAARIGQYGFMAQLDYPSSEVKDAAKTAVRDDLRSLLAAARPEVVYTHNLADKHDTHIGVVMATIQALRDLPPGERPRRVLGCEVWRDLDWLPDASKVVLDVSARENLAASLNGIFDSQIVGGKRYDLAVMGRRRANATFLESHLGDEVDQAWFAMDLTPLIEDASADLVAFVEDHIRQFADDVGVRLRRCLGG